MIEGRDAPFYRATFAQSLEHNISIFLATCKIGRKDAEKRRTVLGFRGGGRNEHDGSSVL